MTTYSRILAQHQKLTGISARPTQKLPRDQVGSSRSLPASILADFQSLFIGSTLLLHGSNIEWISLVTQATFTSSLIHLKAHPTAILNHIAVEYLTPPPTALDRNIKFWGVFIPLSQRQRDVNELVFGSSGEGAGSADEIVVEIIIRGVTGAKRSVERELEAWSSDLGPCQWNDLESLRPICSKHSKSEVRIRFKGSKYFANL